MVSDHSFVNQLTVGRVHARRAIEVENTDRTVAGVYQAKVPKEALLFRDEKKERKTLVHNWHTFANHGQHKQQ